MSEEENEFVGPEAEDLIRINVVSSETQEQLFDLEFTPLEFDMITHAAAYEKTTPEQFVEKLLRELVEKDYPTDERVAEELAGAAESDERRSPGDSDPVRSEEPDEA